MNIEKAKQEIIRTVHAYLRRDAQGRYAIPAVRQRPMLLMGPPGIGKTQIMEQAARECGVALVSYTITHHTRQSAVGLPMIVEKEYGGKTHSVTEYTMSEIIASVYDKMEQTGLREGILFIDEINCVSETLAPTMLQFLQGKTFGNQAVPEGWIIAAAGNPPEYNKSVRDFDIVTLDRVRRMDIEPDYPAFRAYARGAGIHPAVLSFLELHPDCFYKIEADVDGTRFVTARGWEDLSELLYTYEQLDYEADEQVIGEYLQHKRIAEDFAAYWDLYRKYRDDYGVEEILGGNAKPAVYARVLRAPFDERLALVSLLLSGLDRRFADWSLQTAAADGAYAFLRSYKAALRGTQDAVGCLKELTEAAEAEEARKLTAGLLDREEQTCTAVLQGIRREWLQLLNKELPADGDAAFGLLREAFTPLADRSDSVSQSASDALENAFTFMEEAFAAGQEMVVFVTELTLSPRAHRFISENGCDRYYRYNESLLLDSRKAALQQELAAEEARFGQ